MRELEKAAIELFAKDVNKWNAFVDLIDLRAKIHEQWIQQVKNKMRETFSDDDNWNIEFGGSWDMRWHLKSESIQNLNFWFCVNGNFHLVLQNTGGATAEMIKSIFMSEKYRAIRYVWGPEVETNFNHEIKLRLLGKWTFGSPYDGKFNFDRLVWYAGNKTDDFMNQLKERVNALKQPSIMSLLHQLVQDISTRLVAGAAALPAPSH